MDHQCFYVYETAKICLITGFNLEENKPILIVKLVDKRSDIYFKQGSNQRDDEESENQNIFDIKDKALCYHHN